MSAVQAPLDDYLNAIRRRLPLLLGVVAVMGAAAAIHAYSRPDVYRSAAEFRIDLEGPADDRLQPVMLTVYADQYIGSLRQRVLSRDKLQEWIDKARDYPGFADLDPDVSLAAMIVAGTFVDVVTTEVMAPGGARSVALITGFRVGFQSLDPVTAERVAQRMAAEFLEEDRAIRTERAATTLEFLQEQIAIKRAEMSELENRLAEFKEEHTGALPDGMQLTMGTIDRIERDLEAIQSEIRTLEQDRIFRIAQLDQIGPGTGPDTQLAELEREYLRMVSVYGPDHPDMVRVKRQIEALTAGPPPGGTAELARLEAELNAARQRYTDEHPDVMALKRRIDALRAAEDRAASTSPGGDPVYLQLRAQVNAIDTRIAGLRERSRDLRARMVEAEERLARMPQVERDLQALMLDLNSARDTFRNLQDRLSLARQTEALESAERGARITLVQRPFVPEEPAGPQRLRIITLALMFGLAIGGMLAIAVEVVDTKVRGSRDVVAIFEAPPLAIVPVVHNSVSRASTRRKILLFGGVLLIAAVAAASALRIPF